MRSDFSLFWLILAALLIPAGDGTGASARVIGQASTPTGMSVELHVDERNRANLRMQANNGAIRRELALSTPDEVLPLLLDRRLEGIWPALLDWTGPSLEALRARILNDSQTAYLRGRTAFPRLGVEQYVTNRTAAVLQRARMLYQAGHVDEAEALLRAELKRKPASLYELDEQSLVAVQLSTMLQCEGDVPQALEVLRKAELTLGKRTSVLNVLVNGAAILAMEGRYADALSVIERANRQYAAYRRTLVGKVHHVQGSERHFAWIRACALVGLGRSAEAEEVLEPLLTFREPKAFRLPPSGETVAVRLQAYTCMRDRERLVSEMLTNISSGVMAPDSLKWLQAEPAELRTDPAFLLSVKSDPRIIEATRGIFRPLPPELLPAWRGWHLWG